MERVMGPKWVIFDLIKNYCAVWNSFLNICPDRNSIKALQGWLKYFLVNKK